MTEEKLDAMASAPLIQEGSLAWAVVCARAAMPGTAVAVLLEAYENQRKEILRMRLEVKPQKYCLHGEPTVRGGKGCQEFEFESGLTAKEVNALDWADGLGPPHDSPVADGYHQMCVILAAAVRRLVKSEAEAQASAGRMAAQLSAGPELLRQSRANEAELLQENLTAMSMAYDNCGKELSLKTEAFRNMFAEKESLSWKLSKAQDEITALKDTILAQTIALKGREGR